MEFELSYLILLLCFSAFIFTFRKLGNRNPNKPNLPPGPRKLPFIGNLHLFLLSGRSDPPHYKLRDLAKKYGPIMHLELGEIDNIIISSPKTAEKILKTHDLVFASRPSLLATEISCYKKTDIAFAPYGEYWRQLRKITTLELLSAKRVLSFRPIRTEEVSNLCKWIAKNKGLSINLTERVSMTNYDIMLRAALGKNSDEEASFIAVVKESVEFFSVFNITDVYPSIKLFHLISGLKRKMVRMHRKSDRIITRIIDNRKRDIKAGGEEERKEDLLDVLLKIQATGSLGLPFATDNIKAVLVELFGAGIETSTIVIDWAMAEMLRNPEILKKAQDETRRVFDSKGGKVDESYFDELKYLKLVIKETLRYHPPAPLSLPRESRERCEIDGYEIPAKTRVLVNAWAIGRDPEFWGEDAEIFRPQRFLEKQVDFKGSSFGYIPFGAGRRICPGILFGMANLELPLAMFLYHFDWVLPNGMKGDDMDMTEFSGVAGRRKRNLSVIPIVRRPLLY